MFAHCQHSKIYRAPGSTYEHLSIVSAFVRIFSHKNQSYVRYALSRQCLAPPMTMTNSIILPLHRHHRRAVRRRAVAIVNANVRHRATKVTSRVRQLNEAKVICLTIDAQQTVYSLFSVSGSISAHNKLPLEHWSVDDVADSLQSIADASVSYKFRNNVRIYNKISNKSHSFSANRR